MGMGEIVGEFVCRRNVERLIELVYNAPNSEQRQMLITLLAWEESGVLKTPKSRQFWRRSQAGGVGEMTDTPVEEERTVLLERPDQGIEDDGWLTYFPVAPRPDIDVLAGSPDENVAVPPAETRIYSQNR
jgi:hypothetical protein